MPISISLRTDNATSNQAQGRRTEANRLRGAQAYRGPETGEPLSAARLAAEAAFTATRLPQAPTQQARITVRRSKLPGGLAAVADSVEQVVAEVAPRDARVFTIGPAHLGKAAAVSATAMQANAARSAADETPAPEAARPRRLSRVPIDRRPGQVTQVVLVHTALDQPPQTAVRWQVLNDDLRMLTPLLNDIRCAQSLSFIDSSFERHWDRLGQQAQQISVHLGTHLKRVP